MTKSLSLALFIIFLGIIAFLALKASRVTGPTATMTRPGKSPQGLSKATESVKRRMFAPPVAPGKPLYPHISVGDVEVNTAPATRETERRA